MIVGLTGGIGSGKSTVAKMFAVLGVPVYNSDERAKEMYYEAGVKEQVIAILGAEAYDAQAKINRAYISEKIFSNKELLQKINSVIHPAVGRDFKKFVEEHKMSKIIIKESALLFEAGLKDKVDKVIFVSSPLDERIVRIMKRDNASREQVLKRMANQAPDENKIAQSDFVIQNNEQNAIIPQVLRIHKELLNA
jgi:dephospho-CoA kinase